MTAFLDSKLLAAGKVRTRERSLRSGKKRLEPKPGLEPGTY